MKNINSSTLYLIYKYTFPNNKVYIGQTFMGSKRLGNIPQYKGCDLVYNAMLKYKTFTTDIIEDNLSADEVDIREKYWISYYNSTNIEFGYNLESGGNKHKICSDSTKEKRRASLKGKNSGGCYINNGKITKHLKDMNELDSYLANGWVKGNLSIKKTYDNNTRKPHKKHKPLTAETRQKMSLSAKRKVRCIELAMIFDSIKECREYFLNNFNIVNPNICRACKTGIAAHGYHFEYIDGEKENE